VECEVNLGAQSIIVHINLFQTLVRCKMV